MTFDSLVAAFQRGETPEAIASNYDALSLGAGFHISQFTSRSRDRSCREAEAPQRDQSHLSRGEASSSTPRPSVSVAPNNTCPSSLLMAPELGVTLGGGGTISTNIVICAIVPTPGIFVPVCATRRSKPCDHTNTPLSAAPALSNPALRRLRFRY